MTIRQDPENSELDALHDFPDSFDGKCVLEIGCGNGRLTIQYAAEAALVYGIEPTPLTAFSERFFRVSV